MLLEVREGVFVDLREVLGIFDPRTASLPAPASTGAEAPPAAGPGAALVLTDRGVVPAAFDPRRLAQQAQALSARLRLQSGME